MTRDQPASKTEHSATPTGDPRVPLALLATASEIDVPAGFAAVSRRSVVELGMDPLVTYTWIAQQGGYETSVYRSSLRRQHLTGDPRGPIQPEPYFVVPVAALAS